MLQGMTGERFSVKLSQGCVVQVRGGDAPLSNFSGKDLIMIASLIKGCRAGSVAILGV
jgi:hypothetical protein